jgi:hypothetical protein
MEMIGFLELRSYLIAPDIIKVLANIQSRPSYVKAY